MFEWKHNPKLKWYSSLCLPTEMILLLRHLKLEKKLKLGAMTFVHAEAARNTNNAAEKKHKEKMSSKFYPLATKDK